MGRTFVVGDIHGAYRALRQCFERSGFDPAQDRLICLGDVSDGWPDTNLCIDELLRCKHLTLLMGNHDAWTLEWMKEGSKPDIWLVQGGQATVDAYQDRAPFEHLTFLANALPYYLDGKKLFVHAGINPRLPLEAQDKDTFLWDRNLARTALSFREKRIDVKLTDYDEVFLGHTPVASPHPVKACNVWLMDTGAGWSGVLSMMDLGSYEVFTSDPVTSLYPGHSGRSSRRG